MSKQNPEFAVVAINTTGADPSVDQICEIAWVNSNNQHESQLCNPLMTMPVAALSQHHLTSADVGYADPFDLATMVPQTRLLVAHGADQANGFINARRQWICTETMSRQIWPTLERFDADFVRYSLGLSINAPGEIAGRYCEDLQPHRALFKAFTVAAILQAMLGEGFTLNLLAKWSKQRALTASC